MVFQQKLLEKACFIVKMTASAMVWPASSDFWKAPLVFISLAMCRITAYTKNSSNWDFIVKKIKKSQKTYLENPGSRFGTTWQGIMNSIKIYCLPAESQVSIVGLSMLGQ